jgi:hypothetical protein
MTPAPAFAILDVANQPRSETMKSLLFHAIQPGRHQPQLDWANFLREAGDLALPEGTEQLAPNVWLLPDDGQTYLFLSRIGHRHAIATRTLPFVHASGWQPLSTPP